jgi:polysaccharide chain length determinant protein (PEP-CTERM system associated)
MQELLIQVYGYLYGMWRYRWSALVIAWMVAVGGWFFVYSIPDQFQSRSVVYIDTDSVIRPLLDGLAVETDATSELGIMSRMLLSRENLLKVIHETDMDLGAVTPEARNSLAARLAGSIVLTATTDSNKRGASDNIYEISFQSTSAEISYQVVSNLLNTFIEDTLNTSRTDGLLAQRFLDKQIAEYELRLSIAEQALAKFKKDNVGYMPDETGGYYQRLQRAQDSIENTRWESRLAERRLSELRKQLRGESPLLDNSSYGAASAAKLRHYQEQLNSLLNQYTEQHPDVQALRATIADLKANKHTGENESIALGTGDSVEFNPVYQDLKVEISKASIEVETLKAQLLQQERRVEVLKQSIDIIPGVEAKLAKLNRDYDVTHGRYLELVDRRESARLSQEVGQSAGKVNIRVIEPPRVPSRPSGPQRLLLLTGVLFGAMGAGLGWGLLRYFLQPTFVNLRQVKDSIGFPVLGSVSLFLSPEHKARRRQQLATFITATILLVGIFGGVLFYEDIGSALVRSLVTGSGPNKI